jgi:DNA-binding response OmpR family regulator
MAIPKNQTLPLILIADHDENERCLLRAILRLKGFDVVEAADGQAAIDLTRDMRPDLLVISLRLPRVSGSSAIRRIRKQADFQNLPIVAVSLSHSYRRRGRGLAGQSTVHVNKPIEFEELDLLIDRFLPGKRRLLARPGQRRYLPARYRLRY